MTWVKLHSPHKRGLFQKIGKILDPLKKKVLIFAKKLGEGFKKLFQILFYPIRWLFGKIGDLFKSAPSGGNSASISGNLVAVGGGLSALLAAAQWIIGPITLVFEVIGCAIGCVFAGYGVYSAYEGDQESFTNPITA